MQTLAALARSLLNLIYPLHCMGCAKPLEPTAVIGVCSRCLATIRPNPKPHCTSCGRAIGNAAGRCSECTHHRFAFDRAYAVCLYEGVMKTLIHHFKYRGKTQLAASLGTFIVDFLNEERGIMDGIDMITYVPLGARRRRERGFNQSKMLAAHIAGAFAVPVVGTLEKRCSTRPQNELSREERLKNLTGAFRVRTAATAGAKILLVDDVMTTGATLDECARVLREAGAERIVAVALARGA